MPLYAEGPTHEKEELQYHRVLMRVSLKLKDSEYASNTIILTAVPYLLQRLCSHIRAALNRQLGGFLAVSGPTNTDFCVESRPELLKARASHLAWSRATSVCLQDQQRMHSSGAACRVSACFAGLAGRQKLCGRSRLYPEAVFLMPFLARLRMQTAFMGR